MITKEERRLGHEKQELIQANPGHISDSQIIEGSPVFRFISGKGLYLITKYKGVIYHNKMTKGAPVA